MQMSGERVIAADRAAVWAALNDADVLKECIPGCQEMQKTSPTECEAKVVQKVGPVKASFTGEVELTDIVEGHSYRISGKGKGGAAGGASGGAAVRLEEVSEGTKLAYDVDAKVTGKLAQLGSRLIDGFAKKMADDFFDRFKARVEGPGAATGTGASSGGGAAGGQQLQSDPGRLAEADPAAPSAVADAAVTSDADDAPAAPERQKHEVPRPGTARPAASATSTPPVAGHSAGRAHDAAAGATQARSEAAAPATEQKKSWWSRLFG